MAVIAILCCAHATQKLLHMREIERCAAAEIAAIQSWRSEDFGSKDQVAGLCCRCLQRLFKEHAVETVFRFTISLLIAKVRIDRQVF